ncbi:hypothetical protein [Rhodoplanes elegans]|uniref:hypothetical protein n=1 Tax=Rhodoplanes elegans TaxID=29408 RepID=UPI0019120FFE|nr:hypothetical protein [Rhodoplanes elegans]
MTIDLGAIDLGPVGEQTGGRDMNKALLTCMTVSQVKNCIWLTAEKLRRANIFTFDL